MKLSIHSILTNKYVLYIISFLSLVQLFIYIYQNQIDSIIVFMLISYVVYKFTNNMTLIFLIPIVILRVTSLFKIEGFEEEEESKDGDKEEPMTDNHKANSTNSKNTDDKDTTSNDNMLSDLETPSIPEPTPPKPTVDAFSKNGKSGGGGSHKKIENYDNSNLNASMSSYTTNNQEPSPKNKTNSKSRNKESSELYESSNDPNKINYASTLHSNLKYYNDVLGSEGMSKMTSHTKELLEQQAQLGKSIEQFAPLMDQLLPFVNKATLALDKLNPKKQSNLKKEYII